MPTHDRDGKRVQYFADDGLDRSVREMAERERLGLEEVGKPSLAGWLAQERVFCAGLWLRRLTPPCPSPCIIFLSTQDYDKAFAEMAATEASKADSDEYTMDDMFVDRAAKAVPRGKLETRDRERAIHREGRVGS